MKIHGFTLIVSVSACLLLVGCEGVVEQDSGQRNDKKENTDKEKKGGALYTRLANEQLKILISGCKKYHYNTGQHVSKLADFKSPPEGMSEKEWKGPYLGKILADPWGNEMIVESNEETVVVLSCGPNGLKGDSDDLTMEWSNSSGK
ncbi:MAG: type II secretion system protein GspG [Planctomycetota bacterium]|nr:type II secretion system protein GspG [Planctomycetota bacterium]